MAKAAIAKKKLTSRSSGVAHHVVGRTRLTLPLEHRDRETMERIKGALEKHPHVKSVSVNQKTGSVIVHHADSANSAEIVETLGDIIKDAASDVFHSLVSKPAPALSSAKRIKVTHSTPGRTRLRLPGQHRTHEQMNELRDQLKKTPGVKHVEVNHRTGSVLVHHELGEEALEIIGEAFEESGLELFEMLAEGSLGLEFAGIMIVATIVINQLGRITSVFFNPQKGKAGVAHHLHGRTRLRLSKEHLSSANATKAEHSLRSIPGVHNVHVNHQTRSITVHHDGGDKTLDAVAGVLKEIAKDLFESAIKGEETPELDIGLFAQLLEAGGTDESTSGIFSARNLIGLAPLAFILYKRFS